MLCSFSEADRVVRRRLSRCELHNDVRGQARFEDSIGSFSEFIDGYGILFLPTTGRYFQVP